MDDLVLKETERVLLQARLDAMKTRSERNRLGQFATPPALARDIVKYGVSLLEKERSIRFLDPAFGTGAFFSALLAAVSPEQIETAQGYELDAHYGKPAVRLWDGTSLDLRLGDFTRATAPFLESERSNLLICNPPYVRHHHILNGEKARLQQAVLSACGNSLSGLAGLYCHFIGLSSPWMQRGAIAGWLIPSEFMDVNYGKMVKQYLTDKVTLIRIHRFDPNDVQFDDALVSSAVVWFRNELPATCHAVEFTYGGSVCAPRISRAIPVSALREETKWTRFPNSGASDKNIRYRLSDFFTIKRGIATGDNSFFILSREEIVARGLPIELFRPILPSPRYVLTEEIEADHTGAPILDRRLFLLDCRLPESEVEAKYPTLWEYLVSGKDKVSTGYLCRTRKVWYHQEERLPVPILCTYLGRGDAKSGKPFRFLLNHSDAIAANTYLLLYPKPFLARAIARDQTLMRRIWEILNDLNPHSLLGEGRVYGGGLHKLEPSELANVDASRIAEIIPDLDQYPKPVQLDLFGVAVNQR